MKKQKALTFKGISEKGELVIVIILYSTACTWYNGSHAYSKANKRLGYGIGLNRKFTNRLLPKNTYTPWQNFKFQRIVYDVEIVPFHSAAGPGTSRRYQDIFLTPRWAGTRRRRTLSYYTPRAAAVRVWRGGGGGGVDHDYRYARAGRPVARAPSRSHTRGQPGSISPRLIGSGAVVAPRGVPVARAKTETGEKKTFKRDKKKPPGFEKTREKAREKK